MTRQDLRKRHPYHASMAAMLSKKADAIWMRKAGKPYNRHSLRHKVRAWWARIRNRLGV